MVRGMDDVDMVIHRARHGEGDRDLVGLVKVLDALHRGGLSYALDWYETGVFDRAVAAGRRLGAERIAELLATAAGIARSRNRPGLADAIDAFDSRYRADSVAGDLRAALEAQRR
jgi:hypothetical protein